MEIGPDDVVLVTGGTGSFGHAATRRILAQGCRAVRVLTRDETKQHEMRLAFADPRLEMHLGDVRDRASVDRAMAGVDVVFHAAALKQVPSCEFFPMEALRTNVVGSANVIASAQDHRCRAVICLSTDKAVLPVSAMGMTKALMEKVAVAAARRPSDTVVCTVRYGNVLASRGSVVPLFLEQARRGQPITVTDPTMTRFLLPLDDAVGLIDTALTVGASGDTFVRRAPAATIGDLAEACRQLVGADVPVEVIGTRHGEKRFETLATREELWRSTDVDATVIRIPPDARGLDYASYFTEGEPIEEAAGDYHSHNADRLDVAGIVALLRAVELGQAPR